MTTPFPIHAIHVLDNPSSKGSNIWIYKRNGYYLVQQGWDNNTRITDGRIYEGDRGDGGDGLVKSFVEWINRQNQISPPTTNAPTSASKPASV
jgi:hypothetical protein